MIDLELVSICVVSALLVIFASLYFIGTKKRRNLRAAIKNSGDFSNCDKEFGEFVEEMRMITAQLDLVFELGPVFAVCYDYSQSCFHMSENGCSQLGCALENGIGADQKKFESLIHADDLSLYEEVTNFEDIRKREMADSPYILRIRDPSGQYGKYLMRVKPIYDGDGINKALVAAFINTEHISK